MEIIDSHIHYFLTSALTDPSRHADRYTPEQLDRIRERFRQNLAERGQPGMEGGPSTPAEYAARWREELDANGIAAAVFLSLDEDTAPFKAFVDLAPDRFIPYAYVDPLAPGAADRLSAQVAELGARGLKLITTTQCFHPYDRTVYPVWERCVELGIPALVHCGASIGYMADFRYANPLDLQPVLRDFPELPVLLAHFGTGFFREALLLCYQSKNLYLDTSSSNVWMKYQDHPTTLRDVFARALDAAGPQRLVFGTDSSYFPRGFRRDILDAQLEALESLGCTEADRALVMGGNIRRLLRW